MDPRKPHHAIKEAYTLLQILDENQDSQLSWNEIKKHGSRILVSKFYDAARDLHRN